MPLKCVLCQVPYRLHAVLVHEGQANAGHYWAYIYDPRQHCWMKYNDITVTKSSWEELVRDSFGGYRNASAYCLMYIDDKKPFLIEGMTRLGLVLILDCVLSISISAIVCGSCWNSFNFFAVGPVLIYPDLSVFSAEEFDKETGQVLCGMDKLPPDLKQYVKDDNELFDNEIEDWDNQQAPKARQENPLALATAATSASATRSILTASSSPQPTSIQAGSPESQGQGNDLPRQHLDIACLQQ